MPNLLSQRDKKNILREYRVRFAATLLSLLFITIVLSIGEILPSYFFTTTEYKVSESKLESLQATAEARGDVEAAGVISDTALVVDTIEGSIEGGVFKTTVIREVLELRPEGVSISKLVFEGEGEDAKLILTGHAAARPSLIAYSESIRENPRFSKAEVPVQSLAQTEDIDFTMTLTGSF